MDKSVKKSMQDTGIYPLSSDNIAIRQCVPLCLGMVGIIVEASEIREGGEEFAKDSTE